MSNARRAACVLAIGVLLAACQSNPASTAGSAAIPTPPPLSRPAAKPAGALLYAAAGGDGDSWKDTQGVEYRLGLVNTPELSECYGQTASAKRKQLTAAGFRAQSYTVDRYGRRVSVVTLADGRDLNVWLARHGYANDKYLAQFRHENPSLAAQLDPAFAAAKREHAGLWGACTTTHAQGLATPTRQSARGEAMPSTGMHGSRPANVMSSRRRITHAARSNT
ncbi:MAG: hypothetical protein JWP11_1206 [Frankiales bacterium]|nr:hypothetical protein [Frankiales bacterium]